MDAYQEICAKNSAYDIKRIDDPSFKQYGTNLISLNLRRFAIKTSRSIPKRTFTCLQTPLWKNLL